MPLYPKKHWLACASLLAGCIIAYFIFSRVNTYYFDKEKAPHIIDVHVQECLFDGLFDSAYVQQAAYAYDREKYAHSFLVADTVFPGLYSMFFISLGYAFRRCRWYRRVIIVIVIAALFDYGENFSFLYYLYHPSPGMAKQVAFFTSIKSLLFPVNALFSLFLFARGLIMKKTPCASPGNR